MRWLDGPQWDACANRVVRLNVALVMGTVCISNALATVGDALVEGDVDGRPKFDKGAATAGGGPGDGPWRCVHICYNQRCDGDVVKDVVLPNEHRFVAPGGG